MRYAILIGWKEQPYIHKINSTTVSSEEVLYMYPNEEEASEKLIELSEGIIENLEYEISTLESKVAILREKIETFRRKANG